jgi:hypothetical protein
VSQDVPPRQPGPDQTGGDRVAQVGPGEPVARRPGHDLAGQPSQRPVEDAVGAGQLELPPEVDQHLVAPRRHALEQLVQRLVVAQLVEPHPSLHGQHHPQRRPGSHRPILDRFGP